MQTNTEKTPQEIANHIMEQFYRWLGTSQEPVGDIRALQQAFFGGYVWKMYEDKKSHEDN